MQLSFAKVFNIFPALAARNHSTEGQKQHIKQRIGDFSGLASVFDAGKVFREYVQVHRIALLQKAVSDHKLVFGSTTSLVWSKNVRDLALVLGGTNTFLTFAREIAYGHQEKWDGSGYPEGLSGDDIPISARLMAVADVYDALISRRVYKAGMPHEQAVAIIREGRGAHFDPDVVDAFLEIAEEFRAIAERFADRRPTSE